MSTKREFTATLESGRGGGAFVAVPFDVEKVFGQKRVAVTAIIDGVPYRGSLVRMGGPSHILGVPKAIREQLGKSIGDSLTIVVEEDTAPRVVDLPDDLQRALTKRAAEQFGKLSYSHQREYVNWITEAKRDATRVSRIEKAVKMLEEGKKAR